MKTRLRTVVRSGKQPPLIAIMNDRNKGKRSEDQLGTSEKRLCAVLESLSLIGVILDVEGQITFCNDYLIQLSGWRSEDVINQNWFDLFLPPDVQDSIKHAVSINTIASGNVPVHFTNEIVTRQGERRLITWNNTVLREEDGSITGLASIGIDITEQKSLEQVLVDSESRVRSLMDQAPLGIGVSRNGTSIYSNQKYLQIFGLKSAVDMNQRHVSTFFAPEFQEESRERIRLRSLGLPAPDNFESVGIRPDGSRFPMQVQVARVQLVDGNAEIGFITDLTEQKQAEMLLHLRSAALEAAENTIVITDAKGTIEWANPSFTNHTGYSLEEAIGKNPSLLKSGKHDEKFYQNLWQTISSGKVWHGEMTNRRKDGTLIQEEATITPIRNSKGEIEHFIAVKQDITERKKLEAQFLRAQRMESIGVLAGGIAHDLNNILAPIVMSIDILKLSATDTQAKSVLETIEVSAKRGADIVRQVLSFARGVGGERVEIQPKHLLKDLESILKDTFPKDIRLQFAIPKDTWTILGDPTQVHQVLLNLCVNARDAMSHGGSLSVSIENSVLDEQYAAMTPKVKTGRYVLITVVDSGTGIPPEIQDKIFEPFFTTKEVGKGTGLGLSTVMAIVKSHEGTINLYSEPGKGTTFKVYLPVAELSAEERKYQTAQISLPRGNGETVLVVDDEASILTITSQTLQTFGYRVLSATDGAEAVAIYAQHQHEIAVVLTDMMMPVMDGPATIHALMRINPAIKIIAASGFNANGNVAKAAGFGVKEFLTKPYTASSLLKSLRSILDEA